MRITEEEQLLFNKQMDELFGINVTSSPTEKQMAAPKQISVTFGRDELELTLLTREEGCLYDALMWIKTRLERNM